MLTWDPEGAHELSASMGDALADIDAQIAALEQRVLNLRARKAALARAKAWVLEAESRELDAS